MLVEEHYSETVQLFSMQVVADRWTPAHLYYKESQSQQNAIQNSASYEPVKLTYFYYYYYYFFFYKRHFHLLFVPLCFTTFCWSVFGIFFCHQIENYLYFHCTNPNFCIWYIYCVPMWIQSSFLNFENRSFFYLRFTQLPSFFTF